MKQIPIPFDDAGNQIEYPIYREQVWQDNFEFTDELIFEGKVVKGRSAVTFHLTRASNGKKVTMFLSEFAALVPRMSAGRIQGTWTFRKHGQNYSCTPA